MDNDIFVRNLRLEDGVDFSKYPFNIAAVEKIEKLIFDQPVTFLIGENGSGKSTILEAL